MDRRINRRINLSVPHMSGEEERLLKEAFSTNWLSSGGPHVDAFEREVSERLGGRHVLAVSSGTAALHLVLRAIGVGPGDRVALATLTFAGSLFPIMYLGATPVLLDSEETSWNLDPELTREYLRNAARAKELPKALIVVNLYGQHADLDSIAGACDEFDVTMVEDSAESLGATYKGRETATTAPYGILSFNGNKMITTSGGGMVVCEQEAPIGLMRKWANQSRETAIEYLHCELGYNYRMSNVLAAIGRGQLTVLGERVRQRQGVFERYKQGFADLNILRGQPEAPWGMHTRWLSVFSITGGGDTVESPSGTVNQLVRLLGGYSIEARPVWRPMHTQPVAVAAPRVGGEVAERLYRNGICLPSSSSLTIEDQDRVIEAVRSFFGRAD